MVRSDAQRLADFLDEDRGDEGTEGLDHELAGLASLAHALESQAAQPTPRFRSALRERVLATVANDPPRPRWQVRIAAAMCDAFVAWRSSVRAMVSSGALTMLVLLAGVYVGASLSLPGDPLYAIKDAYQQAQLSRASAPADVAVVQLRMAGAKIDDTARAVDLDRPDSATTAARDADELAIDGAQTLLTIYRDTGDESMVTRLALFVGHYRPIVGALHERVGDVDAKLALADLQGTLARIDERVDAVREGCCRVDASEASAWWLLPTDAESWPDCECETDDGDASGEASAPDIIEPPAGDGRPDPPPVEPPDPRDETRETRDRVRDGLDETRDRLRDGVDDTRDRLRDGVEETVEDTRDGVEDPVDDTRDTVEDTTDTVDGMLDSREVPEASGAVEDTTDDDADAGDDGLEAIVGSSMRGDGDTDGDGSGGNEDDGGGNEDDGDEPVSSEGIEDDAVERDETDSDELVR